MTHRVLACTGSLLVALAAGLLGAPPAAAITRAVSTCTDNGTDLRAKVAAADPGDIIIMGIGCHIILRRKRV